MICANEKNIMVTVAAKNLPIGFKTKATFAKGIDEYIKVKMSEMPREFRYSIKGAMEFLKSDP